MVPQDETTFPWSAISRSWFNEVNHLFLLLRNSFLNQQAINQWLAIDRSIQFVFFLAIAHHRHNLLHPDDIPNGVNNQMCLTRRLVSGQLSNSAIQAENH